MHTGEDEYAEKLNRKEGFMHVKSLRQDCNMIKELQINQGENILFR